MTKRRVISFAVLVLLLTFVLWGWGSGLFTVVAKYWGESVARVTLVNDTGQLIVSGKLTICGQEFVIEGFEPGQRWTFDYDVTGDSSFEVAVVFASGDRLTGKVGYVTHGLNFYHVLSVRPDGIFIADMETSI